MAGRQVPIGRERRLRPIRHVVFATQGASPLDGFDRERARLWADGGVLAVTAWPKDAIVIGPELMGIGLSLASFAVADTKQDTKRALEALWDSGQRARELFESWNEPVPGDLSGSSQSGKEWQAQQIQTALEVLAQIEELMLDSYPKLIALLESVKFKSIVQKCDLPFSHDDLRQLFADLLEKYTPKLREARLDLILEAGRRARSVGVDILGNVEAFRDQFRHADFSETIGWQETAHLAANPANAKHVSSVLKSVGHWSKRDTAG